MFFIKNNLNIKYFKLGILAMLPNMLAIALWAIATGVAMGQSSLSVYEAIALALCAYAGSAQLVVLPLFLIKAPVIFIWLAAFVVNTRFIIFSAGLQPYLAHLSYIQRLTLGYLNGDMIYLEFIRRFKTPAIESKERIEQVSFFCGASIINYINWQIFNVLGIIFSQIFKPEWQIGFLGTLALVPILMNSLKEKSLIIITLTSVLFATYFYFLPFRLPLLMGIIISMLSAWLWQNFLIKKHLFKIFSKSNPNEK